MFRLFQAPRDAKLLLALTFLRRASFGLTNQVLTLFLAGAGVSKLRIGWFMTLTLAGDTAISFGLTWFSDTLGRRAVMVAGCVLMLASGVVFALSLDFWVLLAAAILGVISTSGDETGPFKTIEEACLSHLTPPRQRAQVFARYGFLGTFGAALGSLMCGYVVDYWHLALEWPLQKCYRAVFLVYSALAAAKLVLALLLSADCEVSTNADAIETTDQETNQAAAESESDAIESDVLESDAIESDAFEASETDALLGTGLAATTKRYLPRLLVVFMLDSFGYGFMPPAWIVYYFRTVYRASASSLGTLFFFTNMVDSVLSLLSAYTFSVFGPVRAILVAQLPSALFFASVPLWGSYLVAAAFYFLFCACGTMDVVPRQILLTTIFPKRDLVKVLGVVNIAKTFARCIGPVFTGKLAQHDLLYLAFFVNGGCLFLADVILAAGFMHLDQQVLDLHKSS